MSPVDRFHTKRFEIKRVSIAILLIISHLSFVVPLPTEAAFRTKYASDAGTDPFWNNVVLLAGNDSNITGQTSFLDQSRYIRTLTANGNASTTSATAPTGLSSSIAFDGTGDYLEMVDSDDFAPASGDFTAEVWFYQGTNHGAALFNQWNNGASDTNASWMLDTLGASSAVRVLVATGATVKTVTGSIPSAGAWHHLALVVSSGTLYGYLDGVSFGTPVAIGGAVNNSTNPVRIGALSGTLGSYMNGNMASLRVTKGVARYTSNFTPPTLPLKLGTYEPIVATGGTVTTVGNYKVHTFTSSGTFRVLRGTGHVWHLVVAGGGGGGQAFWGGGGGGGGVRSNGGYTYPISVGSYAVTVGAGGITEQNGSNSVFDTITSVGGGRGHDNYAGFGSGGSGGGAGWGSALCNPEGSCYGSGTAGQGNRGGLGVSGFQNGNAGGGGGAGGVGVDATGSVSGNGGPGIASSITGIRVFYGGGGGGGAESGGETPGTGGIGGGGAGSTSNNAPGNGTANTGGGGGGRGGDNTSFAAGTGGSGIVIIRYPIGNSIVKNEQKDSPIVATGGTITTVTQGSNTRKFHTFTSSGTFTITSGKGKVSYLVVGGGGGGGDPTDFAVGGGGGGGGGYLDCRNVTLAAGSYPVTVGLGGGNDQNGNNSSFNGGTAFGGGKGGKNIPDYNGSGGGSGGGAGVHSGATSGGGATQTSNGGCVGYGNPGGTGLSSSPYTGGGGGGAGAAGGPGTGIPTGGAGRTWINGLTYAGGGGSGITGYGGSTNYAGGTGGGGTGNTSDGEANTGGGGGASRAGGSGIVIVSYVVNKEVVANVTRNNNSLTGGLVGYWSFNGPDMAGVTAYDRSGQGNNGTLTNGPVRLGGKIGQALSFNGTNSYLSIGNVSSVNNITQAMSLSAWVYPTDTSSSRMVFSNGANFPTQNGFAGIELAANSQKCGNGGVISGGAINLILSNVGNACGSFYSGGSAMPLNKWTHIAVSYDGTLSSGHAQLYINGVATSTSFYTEGTIGSPSNYSNWAIGSTQTANFYKGYNDEARVYNRVLSPAEVRRLYNMGK